MSITTVPAQIRTLPADHPARLLYERVCQVLPDERPSIEERGDIFTFHWGGFTRRFEMEVNGGVVRYQLFTSGRSGASGIVAAPDAEKWLGLYKPLAEIAELSKNEPTSGPVATVIETHPAASTKRGGRFALLGRLRWW